MGSGKYIFLRYCFGRLKDLAFHNIIRYMRVLHVYLRKLFSYVVKIITARIACNYQFFFSLFRMIYLPYSVRMPHCAAHTTTQHIILKKIFVWPRILLRTEHSAFCFIVNILSYIVQILSQSKGHYIISSIPSPMWPNKIFYSKNIAFVIFKIVLYYYTFFSKFQRII